MINPRKKSSAARAKNVIAHGKSHLFSVRVYKIGTNSMELYSTDGATMLAGFYRQLRKITIPAALHHVAKVFSYYCRNNS